MSKWQLQDAKAQFSQVVDQALKDGPQKITRYGKEVAVLLSADDFELMQRPQHKANVDKIERRFRRRFGSRRRKGESNPVLDDRDGGVR